MTDINVGLIGLGVMGQSLALNLLGQQMHLTAYSYDAAEREAFGKKPDVAPASVAKDLAEFVRAIDRPRIILMMVTAGDAVDRIISDLLPRLSAGDVIVDGGNSHYKDTMRREATLQEQQISLLGSGISGGESGARHGASIMVGGHTRAFAQAEPLFAALAAAVNNEPCYALLGGNGAGHFVKMVHNGIEYGVMQLIAEAYHFMGRGLNLSNAEIKAVFNGWNGGPLRSYLIEISSIIMGTPDHDAGGSLIDLISDRAGQKGTGRWTVDAAMELGVAVPTIVAAVTERQLSALAGLRARAQKLVPPPTTAGRSGTEDQIDRLEQALLAAMYTTYAQGLSLIQAASLAHGWNTNLIKVVSIWRGGCIIRARLLDDLIAALADPDASDNLLLSKEISRRSSGLLPALRDIVIASTAKGIPIPAMASSLNYHASLHTARLPTNLIQAQRDYFGAHTYERVDKPGVFHTSWPHNAEPDP